ncbi:9394_t:CDS:2 [Paraglomus occultum]|uniref:Mediator of RNA polymerase II transcription subunit 21 n=1 Tax=Paraglomus occultum TaxID=144539 RepID=A0A9N9CT88_9GLOM|nr:9394_t:CDS:2 [Paraglomus occultum]
MTKPELIEDRTLTEYDIEKDSTLYLALRLLRDAKKCKKKTYTTPNKIKHKRKKDALDQMARLFSISVNYLSQPHVQNPAEFKKVQHDLVTDICRKAKQVEILIDNLPGATRTEEEQLESISQLEKELQEANENCRKAVQTAEIYLSKLQKRLIL